MEDVEILRKLRSLEGSGYSGGVLMGGAMNDGLRKYQAFAKQMYDKGMSRKEVVAAWRREHPQPSVQEKREKAREYRKTHPATKKKPYEGKSTAEIERKTAILKLRAAKREEKAAKK